MDVDTENFEEAVRSLEEHLPRCAFVALDLEMTGIGGPAATKLQAGDVPQVLYSKNRAVVCQPLNIVQVGICLFEETSPGSFVCRPFNVYVFPRPERDSMHVPMGMSASSMMFLSKCGADFNRWIGKGVPYARSQSAEDAIRSRMPSTTGEAVKEDNAQPVGKERPAPSKPEDVTFVDDVMQKVREFAEGKESGLKLPDMNSFIALVVRNRIGDEFPTLCVEKRTGPDTPRFGERWLTRPTAEAKQARDAAMRLHLESQIGFRRVWNLLKDNKRPIVFHNGFFDTLFLHDAFEGPLPHALATFKSTISSSFPNVFDTKLIAEDPSVRPMLAAANSSLQGLADAVEDRMRANAAKAKQSADDQAAVEVSDTEVAVKFEMAEGFGKYLEGEAFHEAGYDALQTGRVFGYLRSALGDTRTLKFSNKMFLMQVSWEMVFNGADNFQVDGPTRVLYDVDRAINQKAIVEILRPVLDGGRRQYFIRFGGVPAWAGGENTVLLAVYGTDDTKAGSEGRVACEHCLDALLDRQVMQGRLKFRTLEAHLEQVASAAAAKDGQTRDVQPGGKRQRTE